MGVGLAIALGYYFIKKNKSASTASSSGTSSGSSGISTPGGTTTSSLIPQFVNQVYSQASPPSDVTVNNNTTNNTPASTPPPTVTHPQPPQEAQYPAPSGFSGQKLSGTSLRLKWNAESDLYGNPNATYTWVVKDSSGNTKTGNTSGTTATVSGLKPKTGYSVGVYVTQDSTHQNGAPTYSYVTT
jgi:hypothetical protein